METNFTPNNIFIALFSLCTAFTILSYIPDENDYKEFKRNSYKQQLKEEEEKEQEEEKQRQLKEIDDKELQEQCNNKLNSSSNIERPSTSSVWNRLFGWFWSNKQNNINSNGNNTNNSIESFTTTTTTTITTISSVSNALELKAELDQEIQNRNIERKGRLLAEQRLMDELAINQNIIKKNQEIEEYSKKLLILCTLAIQKKKESQQSLSQITEHSNNILNSISQKIQSNYTNSEQQQQQHHNLPIDSEKLTITIDKELLEQFELLSKSMSELQNSSNNQHQVDGNAIDESIFLDLIKTTNNQKLPFTFADII